MVLHVAPATEGLESTSIIQIGGDDESDRGGAAVPAGAVSSQAGGRRVVTPAGSMAPDFGYLEAVAPCSAR